MMNEPLSLALGLGFVLGLKHATEADHLVAVSAIVSEQRSLWRAGIVGALWGVGHTAMLLLVGLIVILLGVAIPERVAAFLELGVAIMITYLGARILYFLARERDSASLHTHTHTPVVTRGAVTSLRPVIIGMVHGLAGSAALTLLVLTEVVRGGSPTLGLVYLLIFGVGSIGGMLLMSTLIGLPFALTTMRFERFNKPVRLVAGISSIIFGFYYAWQIIGELHLES
jgi:sulfite exporter TauE/SafE